MLKQETEKFKLAESYKPSKFIGSVNFESFNKVLSFVFNCLQLIKITQNIFKIG